MGLEDSIKRFTHLVQFKYYLLYPRASKTALYEDRSKRPVNLAYTECTLIASALCRPLFPLCARVSHPLGSKNRWFQLAYNF